MKLYVSATGSGGNSYVLSGDKGESIILDAGVSLTKMLPHIPNLRKVEACCITHEHQDHARYWSEYWSRGITIYASEGTLREMMPSDFPQIVPGAKELTLYKTANFVVYPFAVQHDAAEPFGFLIRYIPTGETLVYATDTYYLKYTFPGVHYWLVECNHCEELVDAETNPVLRRRLKESHMSLRRLKDALMANDLTETVKIVLVHLSDKRSDEKRMVSEISELTGIETVAADAGMTIDLKLVPF